MNAIRILVTLKFGALLALVNVPSAFAAMNLEIVPPAPRYQERVIARLTRPPLVFGYIQGATVTMQNNTISVVYYDFPEIDNASHDVSLGRLPAGTYTVEVRRDGYSAIEAVAQFTVAPAPSPRSGSVPSADFTGQWWDPAEPGWGLAVEQGPTREVFAEWFTHDAQGNPVWYTLAPGGWTNAGAFMTYAGPIYRTTGPYWAAAYVGPPVTQPIGSGEVSFRDANNGTLNFVVDGVRTIKPITRLNIE